MIITDYSEIFQPLVDLFTQFQVQTILMAWLPTKLEPYMSGIMAVDMFLLSIISTGLTAFALASYTLLYPLITEGSLKKKSSVTVQIEYQALGSYGSYTSIHYEALSWIISQQTRSLDDGSFIVQHTNSTTHDREHPPDFNILPEKGQQISIEYKGKKFHVKFNMDEQVKNNPFNHNNNSDDFSNSPNTIKKPSIYLTTVEHSNTNVNDMAEFLNEVTRAHLENQKKMKKRSRYEIDGTWYYVQTLSTIRGLDTVALDESQESLLRKELETFINDKDFYERIGMPYRRGILLYGKPGTGKTSLINAISAQLSRDIYYLNLQNIRNDNELSAAFSSVPPNQIIALEDVDTQSRVLHRRTENHLFSTPKKHSNKNNEEKIDHLSQFSLSTFLGCLDGHILSEGNIIIMTTNHVEHLDPACIRPGRMDVHLDLGYCTHYQIKKMYKSAIENLEAEFPQEILEKIPEGLLPPCEVMMTMVLYRDEIDLIPQKVCELVTKYRNMKPEDIAKRMEEETLRTEAFEAEFTEFLIE